LGLTDLGKLSVCSRLATSVTHRDSRVRAMLFSTIYSRGLLRGTQICFATCAPPLLRMFVRYGFREFLSPITDPASGMLHRTALILDDLEHLERVHSPLHSIARDRGVKPNKRTRLEELFHGYGDLHARLD
jgi:hypothetical protein